jgi:hypothetical protein
MVRPPFRSRAYGELGTVRVGDHLDDGESQSVAVVVAGSGAAQSLEGLEETLDLFGRDGPATVRDRHEGVPVAGSGGDVDTSAAGVVAYRVVDQVGDKALEQSLIADHRRRVDRGANVEVEVRRRSPGGWRARPRSGLAGVSVARAARGRRWRRTGAARGRSPPAVGGRARPRAIPGRATTATSPRARSRTGSAAVAVSVRAGGCPQQRASRTRRP